MTVRPDAEALPSATVIIPTYTMDRFGQTMAAVHALLAGTRLPEQILLAVDNNDELLEALRGACDARVEVVASDGRGAAEARNCALWRATGEIACFLDDDARPDPDWLAEIVRPFTDPTVVGAGGRIVPEWEDPARTLPDELLWVVGATYAGHRVDPGPITRPIGANMAVRRAVLAANGGFLAGFGRDGVGRFTSSNEELMVFSAILERLGGTATVQYAPAAVVHHFAPRWRTSWRYLVRRSRAEGASKADIRRAYGRAVMGHDASYVRSALLPGLGRHAAGAVRHLDRRAARAVGAIVTCSGVTAGAYAWRLLAAPHRAGRGKGTVHIK